MPIIQAHTPIVTQINVFTVPDGQQQPLIDYLSKAAQVAREVDGWISASLHRSLDGTRVVNYAQSADEAAAVPASIIVVADRAGENGEWSDEAGLALLQRLARLNAGAPIICAGVRQRSLIDRGVHGSEELFGGSARPVAGLRVPA